MNKGQGIVIANTFALLSCYSFETVEGRHLKLVGVSPHHIGSRRLQQKKDPPIPASSAEVASYL